MFGLILTAAASLAHEGGTAIGKWETMRRRESVYSLGFLDTFGALVFFLLLAFLVPVSFFAPGFPSGFVFNPASFPTLLAHVLLEILQSWAAVYAVTRADRSTFGFLRILTIPLLLLVDIGLGYAIQANQLAGMILIVGSLILLFINHGLRGKAIWLCVFVAVNAVATISLFKYNITHYNSIEAEQTIVVTVLIIFFFLMARFHHKENPLKLLAKPVFFAQSFLTGIGGVIFSFAFLFAPASVITTAKRAFDILFAIISGRIIFHEKKLWIKALSYALILAGLWLLI